MRFTAKHIIMNLAALFAVSLSAYAERPYGALEQDQTAYALGSLTMNVVLLESDGSYDADTESWLNDDIELLWSEIDQAVAFWESQTASYVEGARLSFNINYVNDGLPVATKYEPISRSGTNTGTKPWVLDSMSNLGYSGINQFTTVQDFNEDTRELFDTDWATTVFVVNSKNDTDGKFSNDMGAFAYLHGPYLVTTYDNGGWGIHNFDRVLAHELGHIFGALDEYEESGRRNTETAGYLNGVNGNAELDGSGNTTVPMQSNSLMLNAALSLNDFTRKQVGLVDSDNDAIPDILDTIPLLSGSTSGSDANTGLFKFSGESEVNPIENLNLQSIGFSNSTRDMTINRIDSAWYNLDGSGWQLIDGGYGGYTEDINLTLDLAWGEHTIDVRTMNSVGNISQVLSYDFISYRPIPGDLNRDGLMASDDVEILVLQIQQEQGGVVQGDLNADGEVNDADKAILHTRMLQEGLTAPDFDDDGVVGLVDLDIMGRNYGQSGMLLSDGDVNGDGVVDEQDLAIYSSVVMVGAPLSAPLSAPMNGSPSSISQVPQPATLLILLSGIGMISRKRMGRLV